MWENFVWVNSKEAGWWRPWRRMASKERKIKFRKKTAEECLRTWFLRVFQPTLKLYRLAFNSFVWTSRSESVRLAFGRRLREIANTFASLYSFSANVCICALLHFMATYGKAPNRYEIPSDQIKLRWICGFWIISFRSAESEYNLNFNGIPILLVFLGYIVLNASLVCVRVFARNLSSTVPRRHSTTRTLIRSLQVKWHSIELFRLIKTFARTAHHMRHWGGRQRQLLLCMRCLSSDLSQEFQSQRRAKIIIIERWRWTRNEMGIPTRSEQHD